MLQASRLCPSTASDITHSMCDAETTQLLSTFYCGRPIPHVSTSGQEVQSILKQHSKRFFNGASRDLVAQCISRRVGGDWECIIPGQRLVSSTHPANEIICAPTLHGTKNESSAPNLCSSMQRRARADIMQCVTDPFTAA